MRLLASALFGVLFGVGLLVSGMTDPARVLAFLDVAGAWNPALALVMGAAVAVALPAFAIARRRGVSALGEPIALPDRFRIDARLVSGAAIFGLGWGLSGICPARRSSSWARTCPGPASSSPRRSSAPGSPEPWAPAAARATARSRPNKRRDAGRAAAGSGRLAGPALHPGANRADGARWPEKRAPRGAPPRRRGIPPPAPSTGAGKHVL